MPNNEIVNTPGLETFWQKLQNNINVFLNNLSLKDWSTLSIMQSKINNNKVYMNHKHTTDNATQARHVHKNRVGIVCHTMSLSSAQTNIGIQYEIESNTTSK